MKRKNLLFAVLMIFILTTVVRAEETITNLSQMNGKRIGIVTGSMFVPLVKEQLPDAKISFFNSTPDLVAALTAGKIDGFTADEPVIRYIMGEDDRISYIPEYLQPINFAYVFRMDEHGEKLRNEISEFLLRSKEDGTLAELDAVWFGNDESRKVLPDYASFPAPNGVLRLASESSKPPFEYVSNNKLIGYEIDIAARFCEQYGYGLEIHNISFDAIIPSVQSGKFDFGCGTISITDERSENVLFSEPDYSGGGVIGIRASSAYAAQSLPAGVCRSLDELDGKTIGVQTGTNFDDMVKNRLPNARLLYLNNKADMINALETGKIEAYVIDEPVIQFEMRQNDELTYIPEYLDTYDFAYVFTENETGKKLQAEMNEYLDKAGNDGTLKALQDKWFHGDESQWTLADYKSFPAANGIIHLATSPEYEPFGFVYNGQPVGYEIDVVVGFCEAYGYGLEIISTSYDSILPSVQAGKYEIGAAGLTITDEREESTLFSDSYFHGGTVMVVMRAKDAAGGKQKSSFGTGIRESFNKTFIREERWKLFAEGIGTTVLITVLSILFGTALGFLLFMLCRNGNPAANAVTGVCLWLVQGMPMVVLLMILFYVVFGSSSISGIVVAVIGFTLTFGSSVFGLLRMGVGAVDNGQYEAAYALGYSNRRTFFRIILPQALPHIWDAYKGEIIGLIKATAVVGYIAVQDLTKMGDIVRSRTYEAFFPLIAVTVIYFGLEVLFGLVVQRIRIGTDPKRRKKEDILKGVDIHD